MKPNRLLKVFREGRVPIGHMITDFGTRNIAQLLSVAGADFAIIDTEHGSFDLSQVADLAAWFRATDLTTIVRIPQITEQLRQAVSRVLDAGAAGVLVPDVKDAATAARVVEAAKYPPIGQRGVGYTVAADFLPIPGTEWMPFSNDNTLVICMMESQEGVDNAEAIASVPGVGGLWVGHNDMTRDLGIVGQFQHPRFLDAVRHVCGVARRHGIPIGCQTLDPQQGQEWRELGFTMFSHGTDVALYLQSLKKGIAGFRELLA